MISHVYIIGNIMRSFRLSNEFIDSVPLVSSGSCQFWTVDGKHFLDCFKWIFVCLFSGVPNLKTIYFWSSKTYTTYLRIINIGNSSRVLKPLRIYLICRFAFMTVLIMCSLKQLSFEMVTPKSSPNFLSLFWYHFCASYTHLSSYLPFSHIAGVHTVPRWKPCWFSGPINTLQRDPLSVHWFRFQIYFYFFLFRMFLGIGHIVQDSRIVRKWWDIRMLDYSVYIIYVNYKHNWPLADQGLWHIVYYRRLIKTISVDCLRLITIS